MRTPRHEFRSTVVRYWQTLRTHGRHHLSGRGSGRHRHHSSTTPTDSRAGIARRGAATLAAVALLGWLTAPTSPGPEIDPGTAESLRQRAEAADTSSRSALREAVEEATAVAPDAIDLVPEAAEPEQSDEADTSEDAGSTDEADEADGRHEANAEEAEAEEAGAEEAGAEEAEAEEAGAEEADAEETAEEEAETEQASNEPKQVAPVGGLNQQQMDHAATIVAIGQRAGLPERAYVVALATVLQETYLRNLANPRVPASFDHRNDGSGRDHDSVGLFQQRPSMGWGSVAQLMDPAYAATKFYEELERVPGWRDLPVTVAAQRVQVSAFPDHYAKHESLAREIVDALT